MINWRRIVVGDAFELSSRHINYYRDLFLIWPFCGFSIVAIMGVLTPSQDHHVFEMKCLGLAVAAILLAKDRLMVFVAGIAYWAVRFLVGALFRPDRAMLSGLAITVALLFISFGHWRTYKPKYELLRDRITLVDLIVVGLGFGLTLAVFSWLKT